MFVNNVVFYCESYSNLEQNKNFATPTLLATVTSFTNTLTTVNGVNWKNYKRLIFVPVVYFSSTDIEYSNIVYETSIIKENVEYRLVQYMAESGTSTKHAEGRIMFTTDGEIKIRHNGVWSLSECKIYGV